MKKSVLRILAIMVVMVIVCTTFASCASKLSGTYVSTLEDDSTAYTFSFFSDKLVMYYDGFEIEGSYEIVEDKIYITIIGDRQEKSFSKEGKSIYIDGVEYVKE